MITTTCHGLSDKGIIIVHPEGCCSERPSSSLSLHNKGPPLSTGFPAPRPGLTSQAVHSTDTVQLPHGRAQDHSEIQASPLTLGLLYVKVYFSASQVPLWVYQHIQVLHDLTACLSDGFPLGLPTWSMIKVGLTLSPGAQ